MSLMLRVKLRKHLLLFAFFPLAVVALLAVPQIFNAATNTNTRILKTTADYAAQNVDTFFFGTVFSRGKYAQSASFVRVLAEDRAAQTNLDKDSAVSAANAQLLAQANAVTELQACMIIDKYDIVRASSLPQYVGRSFSLDYSAQKSVGIKPYVAPIQRPGSIVGAPWDSDVVVLGVPIIKNGTFMGRLVGFYSTDYFVNITNETGDHDSSVAVFDNKNNLVADGSGVFTPAALAGKAGQTLESEFGELSKSDNQYRDFTLKINGVTYECVAHLSRLTEWPVVSIADKQALMMPTYRIVLILFIAGLCCMVIAYFISNGLLDSLIGPLESNFLPAIYRVANGDRKARITYNRDDEIGMVARALNDLMADLGEREIELSASEARYRIIIEGNDYMVFEWNANTDSIELSDLFIKHYGLQPDLTRASQSLRDFRYIHPDDREAYTKFCDDVFVRCVDTSATFRIRKINGEYAWTRGKSVALYNQSHECYGAIGAFADIDAVKREELRLTEQVRTDTVSQVLTRKAFEESTIEMMCQVDTGNLSGRQLCVCFVDIDDFKDFNTQYGHSFGDRVIRFFGEVLKNAVGAYGYAGRVGGDEFALCFAVGKDGLSPAEVVESIHRQLAEGLRTRDDEDNIVITASVGVACYPQNGTDYESLMHEADLDMYATKQSAKTQNRLRELKKLEAAGEEEAT